MVNRGEEEQIKELSLRETHSFHIRTDLVRKMREKCKELGISPKDALESMFMAFIDQEFNQADKRSW